ncbi:MAG: hypothetical protein V2I63_04585 [Pseudomonadales bacterium]|jgi:hypothetical protein|nr:hypothetical protein [Pseudomonadales bacterium]
MEVEDCCLAFAVDATALERLLADGEIGAYRDANPWFVAAERLEAARSRGRVLVALLASGTPLRLSRWAEILDIEVHALASTRETRVRFGRAGAVNPLFETLDSVTLLPAEHRLERERREGLRTRRQHLDPSELSPYALCETPPFLRTLPDPAKT